MKNIFYLASLLLILIFLSCKGVSEKAINQIITSNEIENFENFLIKFRSDSVFRNDRILYPLKGYNSDDSGNGNSIEYEWSKKMNSLDSLKFIKGGDDYRRYINSSVNKGELLASVKVPFYDREGDKEGYTGYKYKHWLRYNYRLNQHIKFGAVASQDANEPFFYGKNKWGYDYYSAYLQLQKLGFLKNLVVGNYRMRTGLGLVLNNNFSFGKTFGIASLSSPTAAIRPHSSRSSGNFLQGAAATFTITRTLEATVFGSYRLIDATMSDDERTIKTIIRTGYHRTNSELDKKNNASQTTAGLNIKYSSLDPSGASSSTA